MKTKILLSVLLGGWFATANLIAQEEADTNSLPAPDAVAPESNELPADQTPQPPDESSSAPAPAAAVPAPSATPPAPVSPPAPANGTWTLSMPVPGSTNAAGGSHGLTFNFHGARLDEVLKYMSDAAGFVILPKVDISGKVDVYSAQPLNKDEAVTLLQRILADKGYSVVRDGRTLTIISSRDAKNHAIVESITEPNQIPNNDDIATDIVAVHSLNAIQLVKDLDSLKPSGVTISANDSANSLVVTGPQSDIRHFTEIVKALDSVNNSSATVRVYHLKYADSKATASLLKDLFPSPDANNRGQGGGFGRLRGGGGGFGGFGGMFGGGGGQGGGGGNGDNPADTGHTPTAKVSAVSDDHSNSLIVSAPDVLIPDIDALVKDLDNPVDDTTEIKVFHLNHADAGETADLLTALFPDDTGASDATRPQIRFTPFGPVGGGQNTSASPSDRAKKASKVVAVPDKRTSSVVVTAGKDLMPQIIDMIHELDSRTDRVYSPHVISLVNTEPIQMQQILQNLFPPSGTTGSSSSSSSTVNQQDYLNARMQTLMQQMNSSQNSGFSGGFGSSGTGRTGN